MPHKPQRGADAFDWPSRYLSAYFPRTPPFIDAKSYSARISGSGTLLSRFFIEAALGRLILSIGGLRLFQDAEAATDDNGADDGTNEEIGPARTGEHHEETSDDDADVDLDVRGGKDPTRAHVNLAVAVLAEENHAGGVGEEGFSCAPTVALLRTGEYGRERPYQRRPPMKEAELSLHRYYIAANRMRVHFDDVVKAGRDNRKSHLVETRLYMSYWYAGLYVVVEGWEELKLEDPEIEKLLKHKNVGLLKRFRNGVFHFQKKYDDARFMNLIQDGEDVVGWIRALTLAFGRWFLDPARRPKKAPPA